MKKVIFMALAGVFMLSSGFMANDSTKKIENKKKPNEIIVLANSDIDFPEIIVKRQIEIIEATFDDDVVRCKIRTCTYVGGELQGCTEWRYTYCDKDSNGSLSEHFSQSPVLISN